MSNDVFTLFSTARISHEEYMNWLHQLNAVMISEEGSLYDARLSRNVRHVWVSLANEEWFNLTMAELAGELEVLANIRQLLGGEPKSAIELVANNALGSKILAVQFAALCAERYPCVVYQAAGSALIPAQNVLKLRDAGMGFDGITWETADPERISWPTRILEEANNLAQQDTEKIPALSDPQTEQHKEELEA